MTPSHFRRYRLSKRHRAREPYENQPPKYDLAIRRYGIYVDGSPLDPRAADVPPRALWQAPDRIPNGFYFMLGDNRNYSDDSHVWGFVRASAFIGRAFLILLPLNRLHVLEKLMTPYELLTIVAVIAVARAVLSLRPVVAGS